MLQSFSKNFVQIVAAVTACFLSTSVILSTALTSPSSTALFEKYDLHLGIKNQKKCSRRSVFSAFPSFVATVAISSSSSRANALDIDSFLKKDFEYKNNEIVKPQMSDDEALCKFGAPSKLTGNACLRAGTFFRFVHNTLFMSFFLLTDLLIFRN
mmetsp:Transcript_65568/g.73166  ORF Transcript_65568/g.73166 Transcript_65568/m.73166 type:complete len:155 (+) Transcript_65568:112-576(+)